MARWHVGDGEAPASRERRLTSASTLNEPPSRAARIPFARIWLHNGMLSWRREDVESLGTVTLRALDTWGARCAAVLPLRALAEANIHHAALESARTQLAGFQEALAIRPDCR